MPTSLAVPTARWLAAARLNLVSGRADSAIPQPIDKVGPSHYRSWKMSRLCARANRRIRSFDNLEEVDPVEDDLAVHDTAAD